MSDVYIPKNSDLASAPNPAGNLGEWYINWEIKHEPPSWATHYQWVYGGNTLTNDLELIYSFLLFNKYLIR